MDQGHTAACMLSAMLFTTAKKWKCPALAEYINKIWHNRTREYGSTIKRSEVYYVSQGGWTLIT